MRNNSNRNREEYPPPPPGRLFGQPDTLDLAGQPLPGAGRRTDEVTAHITAVPGPSRLEQATREAEQRLTEGNVFTDLLHEPIINLPNILSRREDEQESAAMWLADQLTVDDFLEEDEWDGLQREAALWMLNQYREQNPAAFSGAGDLTEEQQQEADRYRELSDRLGGWTQSIDRVGKGARSFLYKLDALPDVLYQSLGAMVQNYRDDRANPEWVAAKEEYDRAMSQLRAYAYDPSSNPLADEEMQELRDTMASANAVMEAEAANNSLGLGSYGVQRMMQADRLAEQAKAGLSDMGKLGYDILAGAADAAPALALTLVPGVGPALSAGVSAAQAGIDQIVDASMDGAGINDAVAQGLLWGGIDAATGALPIGKWMGAVDDVGQNVLGDTLETLWRKNTWRLGQGAGEASLRELSRQTAEYLAGRMFGNQEAPPDFSEWVHEMLISGNKELMGVVAQMLAA